MSAEQAHFPVGFEVDTTPAPRPERVSLRGRYIDIVPFDAAVHSADLYARSHGADKERLWAYLGAAPFPSEEAFNTYYQAAALRDDPLMFAIIDKVSGHAVGHATLMRIDPANRVIEVGNILYTPEMMRTPGGTEAMYLMARHVFETLGYRRYEWKCNALNAPSRRAAERYGFKFEGVFRHHMIVKGHNRDTAWFSMLAEEWPQRAVEFETWLSPENFDENGQQLVALSVLNTDTLDAGERTLRRASLADLAEIKDVQHGAYAKNRDILGVEPIPLQWDYAEVMRQHEVWVADGPHGIAGVLILQPRVDDMLIESVAIATAAQGGGLGNVLLEAAEVRARMLGRHTMRLYTGELLDANVQWYRRRGYLIEQVEQRADRRVVHMVKGLGDDA